MASQNLIDDLLAEIVGSVEVRREAIATIARGFEPDPKAKAPFYLDAPPPLGDARYAIVQADLRIGRLAKALTQICLSGATPKEMGSKS